MPTTSTGDAIRIASVSGLRTNVSSGAPGEHRPLRERTGDATPIGVAASARRCRRRGAPLRGPRAWCPLRRDGGRAARSSRPRSARAHRRRCRRSATRPPRAMNTTRSHSARSSTEWVVNTTVAERSAKLTQVGRPVPALVDGSRPDVGSSRNNTRGSVSSSTAMLARLRCPPLNAPTRTSACSVRPTVVDRGADRFVDLVARRRRRQPETGRVAQRALQRQISVDDVVLGHVADHAAELPWVGVRHRRRRSAPILLRAARCRRSPPAASSCRRRSDRRSRRVRPPRSSNETPSRRVMSPRRDAERGGRRRRP